MLIQPYSREELQFAYCYRVYIRWRTYRAKPCAQLAALGHTDLEEIAREFDIRVLESASDETNTLALVSLKPAETISACTGKLKQRVSKWLRKSLELSQPTSLLSRGYFACTVGNNTRKAVEQYLNQQSEHHGYGERALPPAFSENYTISADDEAYVNPAHAAVIAQFHLALVTSGRRGVFGSEESRAVAAEWRKLQKALRVALLKVSFLPDHVHLALRAHPGSAPADIVVSLMNAAQEIVFEKFPYAAIRAEQERLWQQSAYIGSYGDLASPKIRKYVQNWAAG